MERPGLQRLLSDIREKLIDVVVVYKVDRLTRSLADFAKMVEVFDSHGVSFVAVTQQFNTCVWRIANSGEISNSPHTGKRSGAGEFVATGL